MLFVLPQFSINSHIRYRVFQNLHDIPFFFFVDRPTVKEADSIVNDLGSIHGTLRGWCTLFHGYEYCSMTRQKQLGTLAKVAFPVY